MEQRPLLSIPKTTLENVHNGLSIAAILFSIGYFAFQWSSLPVKMPIHFNAQGEADGYGSKYVLFGLVIIPIILYIGFTVLRNYPHKFNYPMPITERNAAHHYQVSIMLLSWLKLEIIILFSYILWASVRDGLGYAAGLGIWLMPVILVTVVGTIIVAMVRMMKFSA